VPSTTPITSAGSMPAEAVVVQRAIIDGNIPFEGPGIGPGRPLPRPLPGQPAVISSAAEDRVLGTWARGCLAGRAAQCLLFGAGCVGPACWQ
jgi:hypothetical protein